MNKPTSTKETTPKKLSRFQKIRNAFIKWHEKNQNLGFTEIKIGKLKLYIILLSAPPLYFWVFFGFQCWHEFFWGSKSNIYIIFRDFQNTVAGITAILASCIAYEASRFQENQKLKKEAILEDERFIYNLAVIIDNVKTLKKYAHKFVCNSKRSKFSFNIAKKAHQSFQYRLEHIFHNLEEPDRKTALTVIFHYEVIIEALEQNLDTEIPVDHKIIQSLKNDTNFLLDRLKEYDEYHLPAAIFYNPE